VLRLGVASAAIVAGLALWTWSDFADDRSDAEAKVSPAAVAMSDLARWSLVAIERVIESVVARIDEKGLDNLTSDPEMEQLRRFSKYLPETGELFIADRAGQIIVAAPIALHSQLNVEDREWFRALRDGQTGLYVGRALKGRVFHDLIFPVVHAIRGSDGIFIGAVEVRVGITYLAHLFHSLDVGSEATFGLYRTTDGAVVARVPMPEALLDESMATSPYFSGLAKSEAQSWTGWSQSGSDTYLVSARRLNSWPLIVSVSLTKDEIYAGAWKRLLWRSIVAAMILASLTALTVLATRQARREAVLMGELEHRVKNVLGVVGAVIDRAREDNQSCEAFVSSLRGRIQSMADTQTLLSRNRWRGVSLADLISAELKPYATGTNTSIEGPVVHLAPNALHTVAMVIHELATNAAKYGALSTPGGKVAVRWTLTAKGTSAAGLKIDWSETGGPAVAAPTRQGYGSDVIHELLRYEFGGHVDLAFAADGLRCTIELPANDETLAWRWPTSRRANQRIRRWAVLHDLRFPRTITH
jgi:two-component sensor histidine kinase